LTTAGPGGVTRATTVLPIGAVLLGSTTVALAKKAGCPLLVTPRGTRFDLIA
jgi:nucleotide-binding universal stress UspA family protein